MQATSIYLVVSSQGALALQSQRMKVIKDLTIDDLSVTYNAVTNAILLVDNDGTIVFANSHVRNIFGYSPDELIAKSINVLLLQKYRRSHQEHINTFFSNVTHEARTTNSLFPALHASGRFIQVTIGLSSIQLQGKTYAVASIARVIGPRTVIDTFREARDDAQKKIENSQRLLKIGDDSRDPVFVCNEDAKLKFLNKNAIMLFEKRFEDLLQTRIFDIVECTNSAFQFQLETAYKNGRVFTGECILKTGVNGDIIVDATITPVFNGNSISGFVFVARNIANRRMLESQLREDNELLETTARLAKLGFYSYDLANEALEWSDEIYRIYELPTNAVVTIESTLSYYTKEAEETLRAAIERTINTGEPFDLELPFVSAKGKELWVRTVGYAEFIAGKIIKLKGAIQNITYLRKAAINAEQAASAKSNFLTNMSHEIRTPITGIAGLIELLSETSLDDKQKEYVSIIDDSTSSLLFLVNQVLDYAKLHSGMQLLHKKTFEIRSFINEKSHIHAYSSSKKGCEFKVTIESAVPKFIHQDPDRLAQVINNLLSNAVKFTPRGKIELEVSQNDKGVLKFAIRDTGIGIKEEEFEKLFVEFQQLDTSLSRKYQGTGLGLSISQQLVNLMGGEIYVESKYKKGSCFSFTLPYDKPRVKKSKKVSTINIPNTVLLVSDREQARVWRELINHYRLTIKVCQTFKTVIKTIREQCQWQLVVLLDTKLDQFSIDTLVLSVARFIPSPNDILIHNELLGKGNSIIGASPLNFNMLKQDKRLDDPELVLNQIRLLSTWYKEQDNERAIDWPNKHILIAEDNEINQLLFTDMLAGYGVQVSMLENGQEAIDVLEQDDSIDLVVMDCQMPILDGFEATKLIRQNKNKRLSKIKVIAATAHGFDEDIERCFKVGMDDVLVKPFSKVQLISMISRYLS